MEKQSQFEKMLLQCQKSEDYWRLNLTWLNNYDLQRIWIKYLKDRELAFLAPKHFPEYDKYCKRNLRSHDTKSMQMNLKSIGFYKSPRVLNSYYSLAKYRHGVPINDAEFLDIKKSEWRINHYKAMVSYDFVIDIDCNNFEESHTIGYESVILICDYLQKKGYAYEIRFSGMGFHIIVPFEYFNHLGLSFDRDDDNNIYDFYLSLAKTLHDQFSEFIDLTIYDGRRIVKLPYSLSFYKVNGLVYAMVVYPFSSIEEFKYFKVDDYKLENFLTNNPNFPKK